MLFDELYDDSSDDEGENDEFKEYYDTEQLYRIIKISGICTQLQIYTKNNLPLLFKSNIGNLGTGAANAVLVFLILVFAAIFIIRFSPKE